MNNLKISKEDRLRVYNAALHNYEDDFYCLGGGMCIELQVAARNILGLELIFIELAIAFPEFVAVKPEWRLPPTKYWWPKQEKKDRIVAFKTMIKMVEDAIAEDSRTKPRENVWAKIRKLFKL